MIKNKISILNRYCSIIFWSASIKIAIINKKIISVLIIFYCDCPIWTFIWFNFNFDESTMCYVIISVNFKLIIFIVFFVFCSLMALVFIKIFPIMKCWKAFQVMIGAFVWWVFGKYGIRSFLKLVPWFKWDFVVLLDEKMFKFFRMWNREKILMDINGFIMIC